MNDDDSLARQPRRAARIGPFNKSSLIALRDHITADHRHSERRRKVLLGLCNFAISKGDLAGVLVLPILELLRKFEAQDADYGAKMRKGRKPNTVGPVRKAIQKMLKRKPNATTAEVWSAIKVKPPRGMAFYETARQGKYIETDSPAGIRTTTYRTFANIVSAEKNPK